MIAEVHPSGTTRGTVSAARVAAAAAAASLVTLCVLHIIKPELDPSWHYISEYAIGEHGWVMRGYFVLLALGLAAILLAVGTYVRTTAVWVGLMFGAVAVVAFVLAAVATIDPIMTPVDQVSNEARLHGLAATVGNPAFALGSLMLSVALARNAGARSVRPLLIMAGNLPWMSIVVMFAFMWAGLARTNGEFGPDVLIGWPNRLVAVAYASWIIVIAWYVTSRSEK